MTALEIAAGIVAYFSVAFAACAVMSAAAWRDRAIYYRSRLRAREALCHDRRCRLEFDLEPIPFFPPERLRRPQETSTPG